MKKRECWTSKTWWMVPSATAMSTRNKLSHSRDGECYIINPITLDHIFCPEPSSTFSSRPSDTMRAANSFCWKGPSFQQERTSRYFLFLHSFHLVFPTFCPLPGKTLQYSHHGVPRWSHMYQNCNCQNIETNRSLFCPKTQTRCEDGKADDLLHSNY